MQRKHQTFSPVGRQKDDYTGYFLFELLYYPDLRPDCISLSRGEYVPTSFFVFAFFLTNVTSPYTFVIWANAFFYAFAYFFAALFLIATLIV